MPIATEEGGRERGQALAEDSGESSDPIAFEVEDGSTPLSGQRKVTSSQMASEQPSTQPPSGAGRARLQEGQPRSRWAARHPSREETFLGA